METYKEFQAKTVDQAIEAACRFYAVERDALEIDIISGGSSGIFGLGAKKALIRAARRRLSAAPAKPDAVNASPVAASVVSVVPAALEPEAVLDAVEDGDGFEEDDEVSVPAVLTGEELVRLATDIRAIMASLLRPLGTTGEVSVDVSVNPILVHIEDAENSGLIIGRDGQTITALQYLANRIISKSWPRSPRIQLNAGDYREKQEEQLLGVAHFLSEKAKKSGRVQSTRPLSSFHRRVVHMALQNDRGVQTRSKGDGPLKRVLIMPVKRGKPGARPAKRQEVSEARQS